MRVLLTGGGGFLGGAIAERLVRDGHSVRSFSRGRYARLDELGVAQVQGDLAARDAVIAAAKGCDAVVHTAAKAGVFGPYDEYRKANLDGTRNVLAACRVHQIPKLVYTSTPSVVHAGEGIHGGDESLPYVEHPTTAYQATKTEAEREVLAASGARLAAVALRPHLIWGPGDPHLVPRIVSRTRRGRIALPGGGRERVDAVYISNAADAHIAALERIGPNAACAGKAYFITNDEPLPMREIVLGILRAKGVADPRVVSVPVRVAAALGAALETAFTLARTRREPPLTRFVVAQLSTAHWFDISAAKRDLGWEPAVSMKEGFERLARAHEAETRAGSTP